jgi:apolipoprotein N-acyltransferase
MQSLGLDQAGVIDGPLPQPLAPTPYARFGDLLVVPMVMATLGLIALAKRDNKNV